MLGHAGVGDQAGAAAVQRAAAEHLAELNCAAPAGHSTLSPMGDLETIDSELRLLAAVRWSIREHGGQPSSRHVDELLDERLSHSGRLGEDAAVDT